VTLQHLNLVTTHTTGEFDDGTLAILTEAVNDPISLRDLLIAAPGGKFPMGVALTIAEGLINGLAHAHKAGIIHGGLHTRSVVIDKYVLVKVCDFAVARAVLEIAVGTDDDGLCTAYRGYLAPEVAGGGEVTAAADVYAVGAVMYAMLSGNIIEDGKPGRLAATTSIRRLVMRAVDDDADRRFSDALKLRTAFNDAVEADECPFSMPSELFDYVEEARRHQDAFVASEAPPASVLTPPRMSSKLEQALASLEGPEADDPLLGQLGTGSDEPAEARGTSSRGIRYPRSLRSTANTCRG
jgi:serine/threonine protein kinase